MIHSKYGGLLRTTKGGLLRAPRSKITRRRAARRTAGASGVKSSAPITDDALHWFDFSDTTTLWQESTRTTQVSSNNDPIGAVDNKGSDGTGLIQTTGSRRPLWLAAHVNSLGCANFVTGSLQHLDNPITNGLTYPGSVLIVGNTNGTTGAHCMFAWHGSRMSGRFDASEVGITFMSATQTGTAASASTVGETIAMYLTDDGANNQTSDISDDSGGQDTSAVTSTGPGASAAMAIGEDGSLGAHHTGDVCEVIVWDNVKPLAEIQAYVLDKWGVSWV